MYSNVYLKQIYKFGYKRNAKKYCEMLQIKTIEKSGFSGKY